MYEMSRSLRAAGRPAGGSVVGVADPRLDFDAFNQETVDAYTDLL